MRNTVKNYIYWAVAGTLMSVIQFYVLVIGFFAHIWFPLIFWLIFELLIAAVVVRDFYKNFRYFCPNCEKYFKSDNLKEFVFAKHRLMERTLTCPYCGTKNSCDEIHKDDI